MRKKRGEISPVFSFPLNLVPRVPSSPSLGARREQVGDNPGNEVASPFLCARIFIYSCPQSLLFPDPARPEDPWAREPEDLLGTPGPRAQTSAAKRTEGSGDENEFHRERDDLVQGSFFLLQGVAVRDLIIRSSRSWNDGGGNENVKKASGLKGLCHGTYYRFNQLKLVFASIKCQK